MHSSGRSKVGPHSIKRVRNLSQNAGNGHFRNSNFQNLLGDHAPRPPLEHLCLWHSLFPTPFESPGSTPAQVCLDTAEGKNLRALLPPHPSSYMYDAITLILQETLFFTPIILPVKTIFM